MTKEANCTKWIATFLCIFNTICDHVCIYIYIHMYIYMWVFPKMGVPQNGWFFSGKTLLELMIWGKTPIFGNTHKEVRSFFCFFGLRPLQNAQRMRLQELVGSR